jgi:hypothetical protein
MSSGSANPNNRTQFLIDLDRWKRGKMSKAALRDNWKAGRYPTDAWAKFYLQHYGVM